MRGFYRIKDNPSRGNAMKTGEKQATGFTWVHAPVWDYTRRFAWLTG
jgi:hypothetical protein